MYLQIIETDGETAFVNLKQVLFIVEDSIDGAPPTLRIKLNDDIKSEISTFQTIDQLVKSAPLLEQFYKLIDGDTEEVYYINLDNVAIISDLPGNAEIEDRVSIILIDGTEVVPKITAKEFGKKSGVF